MHYEKAISTANPLLTPVVQSSPPPLQPPYIWGDRMAKPNFKFQKRQKELEKKKKQEEKLLRKQEKAAASLAEGDGDELASEERSEPEAE